VLREARSRGQRVDASIFETPAVGHEARRGRALTVTELDELASWFPEHVTRPDPARRPDRAWQHFWFSLTHEMLDLDASAIDDRRKGREEQPRPPDRADTGGDAVLGRADRLRERQPVRVTRDHRPPVDTVGLPGARVGRCIDPAVEHDIEETHAATSAYERSRGWIPPPRRSASDTLTAGAVPASLPASV